MIVTEPLELYCAAYAMPDSQVTWYKDSQAIVTGNDSRIVTVSYPSVSTGLAASRLLINSVVLSDEGVYRCEVEDSGGRNSTDTALTVLGNCAMVDIHGLTRVKLNMLPY